MTVMPNIDWLSRAPGPTFQRSIERLVRNVLHDFLTSKRQEIIARTKSKVAARSAPRATGAELVHGVPLFFEQLIETLKDSERTSGEMKASATKHGNDMERLGFTVAQVVYDYGDVCQVVTELASELGAAISLDEFHTLNRCLHDAIAQAVTAYGRERERSLAERGTERLGALAHDIRNQLATALLSLETLRTGEVSIGGSTGALLQRSLTALNDLPVRSLAEAHEAPTNGTRDAAEMVGYNGRA
jgi:hypothetical protein